MRTKFSGLLTLLLVFLVQITFAQEKTITGNITDAEGLPLPGATIQIKGTSTGTQTDFDGNFTIKASPSNVLIVTFVGFKTIEQEVGNSSNFNFQMEESALALDEVVVETYRTTTKKKSSVAVASVDAKTIEARPNASFVQTLQGQVAGLNISTGSGQPGASSSVTIRGLGSINGSTEPLYIIDGVPQNSQNFRSINPNNIASISVLKDAGATAIYGNRGANGVIVITTKKGSFDSKTTFNYTGTTGYSELQDNNYNMMNSRELLSLERAYGSGRGSTLTDLELSQYDVDTDWFDVFFRKAFMQSHTLGISSGSKNIRTYTSIGYTNQEGILKNTDLKRMNFTSNVDGKSDNGKFNYSSNLNINFSKRTEATNLGTGAVNQNFIIGSLRGAPYISPSEYTDGQGVMDLYTGSGSTLLYTPIMLMDKQRTFSNQYDEIKAVGNFKASYEFFDGFTASTTLGLDYTQNVRSVFQHPDSFNQILFANQDQEYRGQDDNSMSRQLLIDFTNQIRYTTTIDEKHTIEVSALTEYYKGHSRGFAFTQSGLNPYTSGPYSGVGYIGYDGTPYYVPSVSAGKVDTGLFSYFGYADYDYDGKYGINATVRRDASYRFSDTNRWGTFWSVSGRWNIADESFMDNSIFDALKLRASYGTSGNQNISGDSIFNSPYASRDQYGTISTIYNGQTGLGVTSLGNGDLKWETVTQANIGVDFELLENRLSGSLDVYNKKTEDLYQTVNISAINAITAINANNGDMRNRGVELALNYDLIRNHDMNLKLKFTGAYNKNEILTVPEEDGITWNGSSLNANAPGHQLAEYYMVEYAGVNPTNGNLLFYDADGNLTENPDQSTDSKFLDKTFYPTIQGSFGFDFNYKGIYLQTMFTYVTDVWRMNWDYEDLVTPISNIGQFNMSRDILDYWTPTNTNATMPALNASNISSDDISDRFLVDASYVRLRYVTLGYDLPKKVLDKTSFFTSARIFLQAENLYTWSKWRGWDAESTRQSDYSNYPTPKSYTLGLQLNF